MRGTRTRTVRRAPPQLQCPLWHTGPCGHGSTCVKLSCACGSGSRCSAHKHRDPVAWLEASRGQQQCAVGGLHLPPKATDGGSGEAEDI